MPRVPVLPTVQLNPQGPAQYSAPGVVPVQDQSPRQAMAMGEAFQKAGAAIQKRQDIAETEEQFNAVAESDNNEFSKLSTLKGKAAVDAFDAFDKDQQARYRKAIEGAKNDRQRQWLKEKLGDRRVQVLGRATAHKEEQLAIYRYGVAQAATSQAVKDVVTFADGPDRDTYFAALRDRATEQAQLAGVDPEPVAKKAMSDAHVLFTERLVDENRAGEAAAYLQDPKVLEAIDPLDRGKIARVVEVAAGNYKAQALVDDFTARGMSYADQIEAAGLLFQQGTLTAKEREAVESRASVVDNRRRQVAAQEAADVLTAGEQLLASSINAKLTDNPQLYERAERAGVLPQLMQFERSRKSATDPMALAEALSLPDESLAQVSRAELVQRYWGRLTTNDLEAVLSRRDRAAGDGSSRSQGPNVVSLDDRVVSSFLKLKRVAGVEVEDAGKIPPEFAVEFQTFRKNVQEQIDAEREEGGKVTPERIRQILDEAKLDIVYLNQPGFFSKGRPTPRLLLSEQQEGTDSAEGTAGVMSSDQWVPVGAIPPDVRAIIMRQLNAAGQRVNDQSMTDAWVSMGKPKTPAAMPKPPNR